MTNTLVSLVRTVRVPVVVCLAIALAACADDTPHPLAPTNRPSRTTVQGAVSVSPGSIRFPGVIYHQLYTDTVKVTNSGNDVVTIGQIDFGTVDFGWVIFNDAGSAPDCGSYLAPHTSCLIGVAFNPSRVGQITASLVISTNLGPLTVALSGEGLQAALGISPTAISFGDQVVGTTSSAKKVTISNTGTADLQVVKTSLRGYDVGDFVATPSSTNGCVLYAPIAPGSSCEYSVAFAPTVTGARSASLVVETANMLGYYIGTATIDLDGNGTIVTPSADLGVSTTAALTGKTLTYTIAVKNYGPNSATGVMLRDTIPVGTTFASVTAPSDVICSGPSVGGTGVIACSTDVLANGATRTVQIAVKVGATIKGSISNTATVSSMLADPVSGNNSASLTTPLGRK